MNNPGEIHVWPGTIIDIEYGKSVMTLTQIDGEAPEDYVKRCDDIANFALSKVPASSPESFDFSDTTKYKQVGPSSWEALTPGYEPEQDIEESCDH